jgi:hypothetical protein
MYVGVVMANRRRLWVRAMKRTLMMKKSGALMCFRSTSLRFVSYGSICSSMERRTSDNLPSQYYNHPFANN